MKEILDVHDQVKAKNIEIYPFVHLSHTPSSPVTALEVVKGIEKKLLEKKLKVKRSPFGWYKAFDIRCKGHPLAELSRDITSEGDEDDVPDAIKKAVHNAKKNTIKVSVVKGTIPHKVFFKYKAGKILLKPAAPGTGLIAGISTRPILSRAGITDILSKIFVSNTPITVAMATFEALKSLKTVPVDEKEK